MEIPTKVIILYEMIFQPFPDICGSKDVRKKFREKKLEAATVCIST